MLIIRLTAALLLTLSVFAMAANSDVQSIDLQVKRIIALEADPDYGEYLASECHTCHSDTLSNGIPLIYPLPADYIIRALLEYKTAVRDNQVMQVVASGLADEEMAALAVFFTKEQ